MTRIYVSATYQDLKECRKTVQQALRQLGVEDVAMESYVAEDRRPLDRCLADVERCDLYIGIFAWRYGFVPPGQHASITELEYEKAVATGKPCLIFLLDEEAPWPRRHIDREPDATRIEALRARLGEKYVCGMFTGPQQLATLVTAAVARQLVDPGRSIQVLGPAARAAYLTRLHRQLRNLDLDALTPAQDDPGSWRIELSSVFIEPSVRADPPPPPEVPGEELQRLSLHDDDDPGKALSRLEAYRAKPLYPVFDVLARPARRLTVLLGDPGAGKSTVARYVALQLAETTADPRLAALQDHLPVIIEIRTYAALCAENQCETFLEYLGYRYRTGAFALEENALRHHLAAGDPTIVIFDGLDEVFDARRREEVAEQIAGFAAEFPKTRIIVTSRILGYARRALDDAGFEHYTLQDLDISQISAFLTRWFDGVLRENPEDAAPRRLRLLNDIQRSRPLSELAGNPMLLTILAIIGRHQMPPRDRWPVYKHAAGVLVQHWDVSRHLDVAGESPSLADADDKRELLRRLAYRMQTGGLGLSGNYVTTEDLLAVFEAYLVERYELDRPTAHRVARTMIEQLHERNFILSLYGSQIYGFVHRSFLEFFAAEAILNKFQHEREWDFEKVKDVFRERWTESSWREVLRLLAGVLHEPDTGALIELLAQANPSWLIAADPQPPWNLALGVQCLAQVRRISRVAAPAELLLCRIVLLLEQCAPVLPSSKQVLGATILGAPWASGLVSNASADQEIPLGPQPTADLLAETATLIEDEILPAAEIIGSAWPGRERYLAWYRRRGRWLDNSAVGGYAARLAAMLARPADELPALLGHVRESSADVRIANAAVAGLAEAARRVPADLRSGVEPIAAEARQELIRAALSDGRAVVRLAAVEELSWFAGDDEVRDVLVERARTDGYALVRLAALQHLGTDPVAVPVLLDRAGQDRNRQVRAAAVGLLVTAPELTEETELVLLDRCRVDEFAEVVATAAGPLLARSTLATEVREVLVQRAGADGDPAVRRAAVTLLAREAEPVRRPEVFRDLIRHDPAPGVIRAAAEALTVGRTGRHDDVWHTLVARLRDDPDELVRAGLPAILLKTLPGDVRTPAVLIRYATGDPDATVRVAAVEALAAGDLLRDAGRRGSVIALAERDPESAVRQAAVRALAPDIAGAESEVLAGITASDTDPRVRLAAIAALPGRRLSTPASRLLADVTRRDGVAAVRFAALTRLVTHSSGIVLADLLRARATEDPDEEVFAAAASAALDAGDIGELRQLIAGRAGDPNPQVRAAAVRLMVERLPRSAYHVLAERLHDDPHPAVFAAAAEHAVARYADEPDLQDLLLGRLTDQASEIRCTAVRALGRWARTDPAIRRRLVERAADSGDVALQRTAVSVLDVAADLPDVKRMLIERTADPDWSVWITAVRILGRRFPDDQAVRDVLVQHARHAAEPELRRAAEWSLTWAGDPDLDDFPDR